MPPSLERLHSKQHRHKVDKIDEILKPSADSSGSQSCGIKTVFTIGPACQDVETLYKMLTAGATVARVDLSWGDIAYHERSLQNLILAMKKSRRMCAVMLDTMGREIAVKRSVEQAEDGWLKHEDVHEVNIGDKITLTSRDVPASSTVFPLNYSNLSAMCHPGDTVYISRYLETGANSSTNLLVKEVNETDVICEVQTKATLQGLLTVWHIERNPYGPIENKQNELPILTEKDKTMLSTLSKKFEIDFISLSHTREAEDVDEARDFMQQLGHPYTKIIAKVETKYALTRFQDILNRADGIMISRANLGLDVPSEKIALIQKNMISWCNIIGKPCIVTRVVDTMIEAPRPTRAEATDCANIVLDGADGFVLGAETLRGKHPVETVSTVLHIGRVAESQFDSGAHYDYLMAEATQNQEIHSTQQADVSSKIPSDGDRSMRSANSFAEFNNALNAIAAVAVREDVEDSSRHGGILTGTPYLSKVESIASSAVRAAEKINASLLVVYTHSGRTSQMVAKYRPNIPILTLLVPRIQTDTLSWKLEGRGVARQCLIVRGLLPMLAAPRSSTDDALHEALAAAQSRGLVSNGDRVVVVQRIHADFSLKIINVDDLLSPAKVASRAKRGPIRTMSEVNENYVAS
eukprot:g2453.t1